MVTARRRLQDLFGQNKGQHQQVEEKRSALRARIRRVHDMVLGLPDHAGGGGDSAAVAARIKRAKATALNDIAMELNRQEIRDIQARANQGGAPSVPPTLPAGPCSGSIRRSSAAVWYGCLLFHCTSVFPWSSGVCALILSTAGRAGNAGGLDAPHARCWMRVAEALSPASVPVMWLRCWVAASGRVSVRGFLDGGTDSCHEATL